MNAAKLVKPKRFEMRKKELPKNALPGRAIVWVHKYTYTCEMAPLESSNDLISELIDFHPKPALEKQQPYKPAHGSRYTTSHASLPGNGGKVCVGRS